MTTKQALPIVLLQNETPLGKYPGRSSYSPLLSHRSLEAGITPWDVTICFGNSGQEGKSVILTSKQRPDSDESVWLVSVEIEATYPSPQEADEDESDFLPIDIDESSDTNQENEEVEPESTDTSNPVVHAVISSVATSQNEENEEKEEVVIQDAPVVNEPAKRKRRTKAEMEAAKAAETTVNEITVDEMVVTADLEPDPEDVVVAIETPQEVTSVTEEKEETVVGSDLDAIRRFIVLADGGINTVLTIYQIMGDDMFMVIKKLAGDN